ncbi:MAG: hypothetical protein GX667_07105 [Xanthomonadaceae bacterium]|nr:hypothetical protein [Xanthomonadaceae bacterium]
MFGEKLFYRVMQALNQDRISKMQRAIVVQSLHLSQTKNYESLKADRDQYAKRALRPFTTKASIIENTVRASAADRAMRIQKASEEVAA